MPPISERGNAMASLHACRNRSWQVIALLLWFGGSGASTAFAQTLAPMAATIVDGADEPALSFPGVSAPAPAWTSADAPSLSALWSAALQPPSPSEPRDIFVVSAPRGETDRPVLTEVARRVVLDPTTYATAAIVYSSLHLDWKSSQPMFQAGYNEAHPGYTRSGLANDVPVDYGEGRRRNQKLALQLFGRSVANNAISALVERALIARAPRHRKLIRTLGWIERTVFASYFSYVLSVQHFEQWKKNEAMARQLPGR